MQNDRLSLDEVARRVDAKAKAYCDLSDRIWAMPELAFEEHRSVAEQKRYRDEAHARLMAFLTSLRDDEPKLPELVKALEWETYAHYDEHAAQAQAWRKAEGL